MRGKLIVALGLLAAGGIATAAVAVSQRNSEAVDDQVVAQTNTVSVTVRDLVVYDETAGTLGFTDTMSLSSPAAGTVTATVAVGDEIDAGTVVARIDNAPVIALLGDVPAWRELSASSEPGADVRQLEANLVLLGFDPDQAIEIDETFDDATADAVDRWEESLGLEADATVPLSQVVLVGGSLLVDEVSVPIGAGVEPGTTLVSGPLVARDFLVPAAVATGGTLEELLATGTPVGAGTILFWQGGIPVVAVETDLAVTPALDRELSVGVADGTDVQVLETLLESVGADVGGDLVVDDHFDEATGEAVLAWWAELGVDTRTGTDGAAITAAEVVVPAGSLVGVPAGLRAGAPGVFEGSTLAGDLIGLHLSVPTRLIEISVELGDEDYAEGASVEVVFPDETVVPGVVAEVGAVASAADANTPGSSPTVPVRIELLDEIPEAVASLVQIPVTVRVSGDQALDALVVPVSALVALAEGGYAVEVVDGEATPAADGSPATHLVAVETGVFADGFVEVTGAVADGDQVIVPT